ncbi:DUF4160 domain-containing protein [Myxococcota bacterium]|nr:DUF4160 domain-containing protein [Myxococcota bacterium]MBU1511506.1 DUF4160 domain-containing protein [Myxococcota bacterium]
MPIISMFHGVIIRMFFNDDKKHHIPHIHAEYQGKEAVYSIIDGDRLGGEIQASREKLVLAWIEIHKEDLQAAWNLAIRGSGILPIKGLE